MKLSKLLLLGVLVVPLLGADEGCGSGSEPSPGANPSTESKCTPRTCIDGCCVKDSCYRSHTRDVCGSFGTECAMCQPLQSCQAPDESRGWECLADQSSRWTVQPQGASISALDPLDGEGWDADSSAPDVVVELSCPVAGSLVKVRTSEVSSYSPVWVDGACLTTAPELLKAPVAIKVIDVDAFFDDTIFSTSYSFKDADFKAGSVTIPIAADGISQLKLRLSRAP